MRGTEKFFFEKILAWYEINKRTLPWRGTRDAYTIWVSEVILQQTRVDQGLPYFERFIKTFPNVKSLAVSPEEKILRIWQGLGYYSRARNMHRCAQKVLREHNGIFPVTFTELLNLPGIGPYTAAAVSSIAAGDPSPVVDGNVFRVLSRFFGLEQAINTPAGKNLFSEKAAAIMKEVWSQKVSPGEYNQAIMEFGALQCVPRNPDCGHCPLSRKCFANSTSTQNLLPVKNKRPSKRERFLNYLVIRSSGKIWMKKRAAGDVWQGLYDFMMVETRSKASASQLKKKFESVIGRTVVLKKLKSLKHELTHQRLHAVFYSYDVEVKPSDFKLEGGKFFTSSQAARLPKPVFIDRLLSEVS